MKKEIKNKIEKLKEEFGKKRITHTWDAKKINEKYPEWYLFEFGKYCREETLKKIFDFFDIHLDWGEIPLEENPLDCVFQKKDYLRFKKEMEEE